MMSWMESVDVYSCMMFEAAGDSEADSDINHLGLSDDGACLNDDDAMSCSCDGELRDRLPSGDNVDEEKQATDHDKVYKVYDDGDDDEDEEDDAVNQILKPKTNSSRHVKSQGTNQDFWVCSDSTMLKLMDDKDRDKLFWETCLAS